MLTYSRISVFTGIAVFSLLRAGSEKPPEDDDILHTNINHWNFPEFTPLVLRLECERRWGIPLLVAAADFDWKVSLEEFPLDGDLTWHIILIVAGWSDYDCGIGKHI